MGWLEDLREHIPITRRRVYLDNAGAGPLTKDAVDAVNEFLNLWITEGEPWELALDHIVEAKREFGRLINAPPSNIAAVPSATHGLNALLSTLRFRPGSNVVISELNFPTGVFSFHALRRRGAIREVRIARAVGGYVPLETYEKLIDDNTAVVFVDYVSWVTGYRERIKELTEIAHARGAIMITDAFHAVGVIPIDVTKDGVDALITGSYKWLMGPHGAGFVYVSDELLGGLEPMFSGWMGIEDNQVSRRLRGERLFERPINIEDFKPAGDASRLEWGTWPVVAFEGTLASMRLINKYELPNRFADHTSTLFRRLVEGLSNLGLRVTTPLDSHAAIVTFEFRDPYNLANYLSKHGVVVSPRPGIIRVSPHAYNTVDEVDRFLELMSKYLREAR
ncbi:aminotransferase class V-fold PLP-dependent enzyme [Vulcanisaeta thermophila]|uniref:aminotransferase class V-fold PLP-dependent enzyme n=1 Tax=Vulcanisaeta thermophila TaxID=867917 RepID=UPI00085377A2|nr:aminotransferase class V-fold PLP-dependent enzyme [Vulcanisaeta thermophila]